MTGIVMDAVLMLLLVAALGYGVRLEKRLKALRAGQAAFAGAVSELNTAAARAEAALASLRASGQETDLLHDRIVKARAVKAELEALIARGATQPGADSPSVSPADRRRSTSPSLRDREETRFPPRVSGEGDREAVEGPAPRLLSPEQVDRFAPVLQALAANQAAKQSLNRARRSLDEDLFAA